MSNIMKILKMDNDNEKIDWLAVCSRNNIEACSFTDFIKEKIINDHDGDSIESNNNKDYISIMNRLLNNFSQLSFETEPIPEKKFRCHITYKGKDVEGIGLSKKEAKQKTCKRLYEIEIGHENQSHISRSESEESNSSSSPSHSDSSVLNAPSSTSEESIKQTLIVALPMTSSTTTIDYISDLQIFCSRNRTFISMPEYSFKQVDRTFHCTCYLQPKNDIYQPFNGQGQGANMKEAKKQAAKQAFIALKTFFGQKLCNE
ncbi:uncharacterized protein LOC113792075 [Dermatophagoides pteronyssinus]|uniref:Uncharacterized protein LOC113792075 n=2 Tax=Dermatophagoides pteronyssinus TaxID=6956 RepID=A0A6P6XX59_DERPT|nr:uncharacterized protein LOC113792075 [Dermatophagoides pteronyssinus]